MNTQHIAAESRFDIAALIAAREILERGQPVEVVFKCGAEPVIFKPADLPVLRSKLLYAI